MLMTRIGSIINVVAMITAITKKDMMTIMVGTRSIIPVQDIFTGITKSGVDTIFVGTIIVVGITIAGTKSIINAGIITGLNTTIGRVIGCTIIIITIIVDHMKGPLSDSN